MTLQLGVSVFRSGGGAIRHADPESTADISPTPSIVGEHQLVKGERLRTTAMASSASAASACSTSCRSVRKKLEHRVRVREGGSRVRPLISRRRPDRRLRRNRFRIRGDSKDIFKPDIVVQQPLHMARHARAVDAFTFDFRRTSMADQAHIPLRRRHLDLHRDNEENFLEHGLDKLPTRRSSSCSAIRSSSRARSGWPRRRCTSRGCPPGSAGSATASGTWPGCASTRSSPAAAQRAGRDRPRPPRLGVGRASPSARPSRCRTAPTRSPTGRSSTRC